MTPARARGLWLTAPRALEFRDELVGAMEPNQLLVRAICSAVSHGTEMLAYRGLIAPGLTLDLPTFAGSFSYPLKYGYACVGEVIEAGAAVADVAPGDPVFCYHPHQELFALDASLAVRLPREVPNDRGVFFANLETAFNTLLDAGPRLEETVAVFGQGVVGLLVTHLLIRNGVRVLVVEPAARRRTEAERLGARAIDPDADTAAAIRGATGGRGADLVIEASGSPLALQTALGCVAFEGTIVVVSWYGVKPAMLDLGTDFHRRRLRIVSSQVGALNASLSSRWSRERRSETVVRLLAELPLETLITHRVPFDDAPRAYRLVDEQSEKTVQVLLTYRADTGG